MLILVGVMTSGEMSMFAVAMSVVVSAGVTSVMLDARVVVLVTIAMVSMGALEIV